MRGDRVKLLRKKFNMSQGKLAELLEVDRSMISRYENLNNQPKGDILLKMSEIFHVSQAFILGIDDETSNEEALDLSPSEKEIVERYRSFSEQEISLIEKFRALDERGKRHVVSVLNLEYEEALELLAERKIG